MDVTRQVDRMRVPEFYYEELERKEALRNLQTAYEKFEALEEELCVILEKNKWLRIENMPVYYNKEFHLLMPDPEKFNNNKVSNSQQGKKKVKLDFYGFDGGLLDSQKINTIFFRDKESPFYRKYSNVVYGTKRDYKWRNDNECFDFSTMPGEGDDTNRKASRVFMASLTNTEIYYFPAYMLEFDRSYLEIFVRHNLLPVGLSKTGQGLFRTLKSLYDEGSIQLYKNIQPTEKIKDQVLNKKRKTINGIVLYPDKKKREEIDFSNITLSISKENRSQMLSEYLNCDRVRADLEPYDIKRMEDPQLGHWELWEESDQMAKTNCWLQARNPLADVKSNGMIGIDFGTKSTIVAYQNGNDITQPMRIGVGKLSRQVREDDFENPTVMEFVDLEHFLSAYKEKEGRPYTQWNDLAVSHTAYHSLINVEAKSDEYYSFFYDLKQWAGDSSRQMKIRDKKGRERILLPYLKCDEEGFDPIEIYAYYIGLYINNMRNGIYMKYLLSFPVTYEKAVREKILKSFERGIKKSLPEPVLWDKKAMESFSVCQGASEPAAYAICALQQYGFDPDENEKIFYGIFDFGGGTTDFDFGIWRGADPEDEHHDYVIKSFGAGGDRYLGGENLLELLAYTVFCDNLELCREERITFQMPEESPVIPENIKYFISDSQEAKMNMKQLTEKLRPFWERENDTYADEYMEGIQLHLFDRDGNPKMNLRLAVDVEKLDNILYDRIERGVENFFAALSMTFSDKRIQETQEMNRLHIFLAGNSTKSSIVREIFDKWIHQRTEELRERNGQENQRFFEIFPPLGGSEARKIQEERGVYENGDLTLPTGKTGVAFGLLDGRQGGRIQVLSEREKQSEAAFSYYLGINRKRKFQVKISREEDYYKWIRFISAEYDTVELYYTDLPAAVTNTLDIRSVSRTSLILEETGSELSVYIRFIKPTVIEYGTGKTEEEIQHTKQTELL